MITQTTAHTASITLEYSSSQNCNFWMHCILLSLSLEFNYRTSFHLFRITLLLSRNSLGAMLHTVIQKVNKTKLDIMT